MTYTIFTRLSKERTARNRYTVVITVIEMGTVYKHVGDFDEVVLINKDPFIHSMSSTSYQNVLLVLKMDIKYKNKQEILLKTAS